jgi:putative transposase
MARPLRIERPGGWYHVTARGNERRAIYRDDRDRNHFCELLAEMVFRFRVRLHAYVLMENHYHLLLELTEANLSRAVQWLNVSYSVWFNRRHERSGHLFQGRFKSVAVCPQEWGLELSRYVHLNPVRVGKHGLNKAQRQQIRAGASDAPDARVVQERIATLQRYRWSSYRSYIGPGPQPEWLECGEVLKLGGGRKGEERRQYREYVESAVREGLERSPWENLKEQVVLGSAEFLAGVRKHASGDKREQRASGRLAVARPGFEEVIECVEKVKGERWEEFRDRHGDHGRDLALYLGRRLGGVKLDELAAAVGAGEYAAVAMAIRRYEKLMEKDRVERGLANRATQMLQVKM